MLVAPTMMMVIWWWRHATKNDFTNSMHLYFSFVCDQDDFDMSTVMFNNKLRRQAEIKQYKEVSEGRPNKIKKYIMNHYKKWVKCSLEHLPSLRFLLNILHRKWGNLNTFRKLPQARLSRVVLMLWIMTLKRRAKMSPSLKHSPRHLRNGRTDTHF